MPEQVIGGHLAIHRLVKLHDVLLANLARDYWAAGLSELSPSHGGILSELARGHALTMGELAQVTNRDKSTVTGLCQKLEKLALITRNIDPSDLRLIRACLTAAGKKAALKVRRIAKNQVNILERVLSESERETLDTLLEKWYRAARETAGETVETPGHMRRTRT